MVTTLACGGESASHLVADLVGDLRLGQAVDEAHLDDLALGCRNRRELSSAVQVVLDEKETLAGLGGHGSQLPLGVCGEIQVVLLVRG